MIGKNILHYKILEKLGEGGMGVVYKAEDTKLNRTVALKFLPTTQLATDEDKQRFQQEAKAAAQLSHANIATVYEINEYDGATFIAMEYIEGGSISDEVKKRPLKIKDALKIAQQIAEGLHCAHELGIVHRDIKSANIMITKKGVAKIMDFGLAKMSTASMLTKAGTTLGTISYMSPEQAQGENVDHRSDIWSLGVVLYEMISGQLPFKGDYESAIIYSIMNEPPEPLTAVRTGVPMDLEKIVNKLIAKDPAERYQNIIELPVDLKTVGTNETGSSIISESLAKKNEVNFKFKYSNQTISAFATGAVMFFIAAWFLKPDSAATKLSPLRKSNIVLEDSIHFHPSSWNSLALTRDGSKLAYYAYSGVEQAQFHLRSLDSYETFSIPDLGSNIRSPFFSPDGRWLGFMSVVGELKKVTVDGGTPLLIAKIRGGANNLGFAWGNDDTIVYGSHDTLYQVSATAGIPKSLFGVDEGLRISFPSFLPGEKEMLFSVGPPGQLSESRIGLYSFETGTHRILLNEEGYNAVYSYSGHILYGRSGAIMAVPFDIDSGELIGDPVPVLNDVNTSLNGGMMFALANDGTAVYVPGSAETQSSVPVGKVSRVNSDGKISTLYDNALSVRRVRYSPDRKTVAIGIYAGNIFLYNITSGSLSQFTFLNGRNISSMEWSPKSDYIAFSSTNIDSLPGIYLKKADNTSREFPIYNSKTTPFVSDWSDDGKYIFFNEGSDIYVYSLEDSTARKYMETSTREGDASISPNGKFVAYQSNESGSIEIYVRQFPESNAGLWKVSVGGGINPVWAPDGKKLYYRAPESTRIYSVDVDITGVFTYKNPMLYFDAGSKIYAATLSRVFDIDPLGDSFLIIKDTHSGLDDELSNNINLVQNWFEELKRLAPAAKK